MLKVNKIQTRTRSEIFSKLSRKKRLSDVLTVIFQHVSHLALVFLLLNLTTVEQYVKLDSKTAVALFSVSKILLVFVKF